MDYTFKKDSVKLLNEIENALEDVLFGSVQIFITDGQVSQITKTVIKKTNLKLGATEKVENQLPNTNNDTKKSLEI